MQIHYCQQRSEEWRKLRCGKLTGSMFHCLMGDSWSTHSYLLKKAIERVTYKNVDTPIWSEDIQRGIDLEDTAAAAYELETGNKTYKVGFVEFDEFVGCSPDRLVGVEGMIEVKCPNEDNFWIMSRKPRVAPAHYTQIQFNLYVCNRKWCDYVVHQSMERPIIIRVYRDEAYVKRIEDRIAKANINIERYVKQLRLTFTCKSLKLRKFKELAGWRYAEQF